MLAPQMPFQQSQVQAAFAAFPEAVTPKLLMLRQLIFDVAESTPGVGRIEETLKWGQPAYLTPETKSGSTLRLGATRSGGFAIYTHCRTTIISDFQHHFPNEFQYEGNRAIQFDAGSDLPKRALELFIASALTYHI